LSLTDTLGEPAARFRWIRQFRYHHSLDREAPPIRRRCSIYRPRLHDYPARRTTPRGNRLVLPRMHKAEVLRQYTR